MTKTVYKLRPSDYWRIGEHESWFQDLAAKGFHLKKMGLYFAKFAKNEPKQMKYRIEVSKNKRINPEQVQMYEESGWDHVTSYGLFHVFRSPINRNAPELHTDPAEQSYTLKELDKKLANNAGIVAIGLVLMIGMLSAVWFLDGTPTYTLVQGLAIQNTILTIFIGYLTYTSLQAAISIRALRKNLLEGKAINHHAPWKKHYRLHSTITLLFTVLVGLSALLPIQYLIKSDTKTLPDKSPDLPIVRLADIEQSPDLVRGESMYMRDNVDWSNRYTYNWSPFAPLQYEADENGVIPGKVWDDGSGEYSPSISSSVYRLSIPAMADNLVFDLIERYQYQYRDEDYVEKKHPELDLLIVHEEADFKEVYASKGRVVMHVRYYGHEDIVLLIENVVERIKLISK